MYLFLLPILLWQLDHQFPDYKGSNVDDQTKNKAIIDELIKSYFMELETVVNYLANSVNLDGVRAEEIKKSLDADVT